MAGRGSQTIERSEMAKCRVKLRAIIHYESEYWITLGEGGYADMVTPQEAAEIDQTHLAADPISWLMLEESDIPNSIDVMVQIEAVETL